MKEVLLVIGIIAGALVLFPFAMYLCFKYGTYGYHAGKKMFRLHNPTREDIDGKSN